MIEIRRATLTDKQAIFEFLSKAYRELAQYKFPERWEWQFEKNPFREDNELPIWIAVDEKGTIVGQICAMIEPLKIGTEIHRLGWGVDAIVLPEYRDQKIGVKLYQADFDGNDIYIGMIMNEPARHLHMKVGGIPIDSVAVFNRVARFDTLSTFNAFRNRLTTKWPGKVLLWLLHLFGLDRLITILINANVWIRDLGLSRYGNTELEIKQIDEFDQAADQFWDSVSPQFHAIVIRNSKYLNWKYVQQPHMDYQLFTALRAGKMAGYVILRKTRAPESNSGIIADLFVPFEDKAVIYSLLVFAVQYFKQQKVKYIEAASSSDVYKNALLAMGFKKKKDVTPLFHSNIETPGIESALTPGSWFFGRSDHDWDQFPYG